MKQLLKLILITSLFFVNTAFSEVSGTILTYNGKPYSVKQGIIQESSSGNNEVVAAVTGAKICVLSYSYVASGTVNVKWRTASTDISGLAYLGAGGGKVNNHNPHCWFKTATGEALNMNLSGATAVGGELTYYELIE